MTRSWNASRAGARARPGRSVFDLSLSTPPSQSGGPAPPIQKTKQNRYAPLHSRYMRRRRNFEGWRPKMSIFLHFDGQDDLGDHRTPGRIESWSLNGGQDGLCDPRVHVGGPLRPLRPLHPSCTRSVSVLRPGPRAPILFSCFRFLPLSHSLGSPGPHTFREFKNAPPCAPRVSRLPST